MVDINKHKWMEYGGPAFPSESNDVHFKGMTLRDYFAGQALQGMLARSNCEIENQAVFAYQYADAMLKERAK